MKKILLLLLGILVILFVFPGTAQADIGPKPSVVIRFKGLDGETYYATLLASVQSTGPYSALEEGGQAYAHYQEGDEDYDIFLKFASYEDADGFYFLQYFQDCSLTNQFSWNYYPPREFKILLYFPETDAFTVSAESYERYAFDSYYTAKISPAATPGEAGMTVTKSYAYGLEIASLLARILLTLAVELLIALLFGFREKRQFRFIVLVNLVTQVALNLTLNFINYQAGPLAFVFFYILLEIAVFLIEGVLYTVYLNKLSEKRVLARKAWGYALSANSASFALGLALAYWLPGIF